MRILDLSKSYIVTLGITPHFENMNRKFLEGGEGEGDGRGEGRDNSQLYCFRIQLVNGIKKK